MVNRRGFLFGNKNKESQATEGAAESTEVRAEQGGTEGGEHFWNKSIPRGEFLKTTGLALGAIGLQSCDFFKPKFEFVYNDPDIDTLGTMNDKFGAPYSMFKDMPVATPNVSKGKAALFYPTVNAVVKESSDKFEDLVVQPGNTPAASAPKNACAYVSVTGVNQGDKHQALLDLSAKIDKIDGFLKDKDGKRLLDPNRNPKSDTVWMYDLRNPEVFQLVKAHILSLANQYNGVFFDALDSIVGLENNAKQDGNSALLEAKNGEMVADAAVRLIQECCAEIPQSKRTIVNTAFAVRTEAPKDRDILKGIAKMNHVDMIATENRYYQRPGNIYESAADYNWTMTRMKTLFDAYAANGKSQINLFGIEPARDNFQTDAACKASRVYQKWATELAPYGLAVNATVYACDGHNKVADVQANAQFAANPSLSCFSR